MMSKIEFGQYIRKIRKKKKISLKKLATEIKTSALLVSQLEKGYSFPFTEERVRKLAITLDIDQEDLLALAFKLLYPTKKFLENPRDWLTRCRYKRKKY